MDLLLSKLISLAHEYGFTLIFAVCAMVLLGWVIKLTLGYLLRSHKEKDVLISNHIDHLTRAVTGSKEEVAELRSDMKETFELLRSDLKDGFGQLSGTFEKGLERQERIIGKVLENKRT